MQPRQTEVRFPPIGDRFGLADLRSRRATSRRDQGRASRQRAISSRVMGMVGTMPATPGRRQPPVAPIQGAAGEAFAGAGAPNTVRLALGRSARSHPHPAPLPLHCCCWSCRQCCSTAWPLRWSLRPHNVQQDRNPNVVKATGGAQEAEVLRGFGRANAA